MKKSKQQPKRTDTSAKQSRQDSFLSLITAKETRWYFLGVTAFTLLVFLPMLANGFTNWDDTGYITANNLSFTANNLKRLATETFISNYHPLTMISLSLNHLMAGYEPFVYHLTNLLLHVANTMLVFYFSYKLSDKKVGVAFITALFFGIHPMHVESVAWASERKDVLYAFFFFLGLISYLKYQKQPNSKLYLITLLWFVLSLLSKPAAVVFPVVLLLLDYYKERNFTAKVILEKIPFFAGSLALGVATIMIQSERAIASTDTHDLLSRLLFGCYGFVVYIFKLFVPYNLSALHPFPAPYEMGWLIKLSPVFALVILAGAGYCWRKNRLITFGVLFYLVTIVLVLQFLSVGNAIIAERYTYVPYVGILFVLGHCYAKFTTEPKRLNKILPILVAIIAIGFAFLSFNRIKVWKNSKVLWTDVISKYPQKARAYAMRGEYYHENKQSEKAIADYNKSLEIRSDFVLALEKRSRWLVENQQGERALQDVGQLIKLRPELSVPYLTRGKIYETFYNDFDKALEDYNTSVGINPREPDAYNLLGALYFNKFKNYNKALKNFNKAVQLNPSKGMFYSNLVNCHYMLNDFENARLAATKAKQLGAPVNAEILKVIQQ